jgi:hypothetical protein
MAWSKIHFYYAHQLSGLTATTADANYPISNILDRLDGTMYKGTSTATHYITYDAGSGNTYTADYFTIGGDNLAGATVVLQYSTDNFSADINDAFTAFTRTGSDPVVKEFTSQAKRYWRIKLTGLTVNPQIALAHWGLRTELDYADVSYDPDAEEFKGNINVSEIGYLSGVHTKYYEKQIDIGFDDADDALYQKIKTWWRAVGMGCFFMAWEKTDHASDIWIVRPSPKRFKNPLTQGGGYRDINLALLGRR